MYRGTVSVVVVVLLSILAVVLLFILAVVLLFILVWYNLRNLETREDK